MIKRAHLGMAEILSGQRQATHGSREAFGVRGIPALWQGSFEKARGCRALQTLREIHGLHTLLAFCLCFALLTLRASGAATEEITVLGHLGNIKPIPVNIS